MFDNENTTAGKPFSEVLEGLIATPPAGSVTFKVTPEMAKVMLERNTANRPFRLKLAQKYAAEMQRGEWRNTRETIVFSESGVLFDGQHRLSGSVFSDTAFEVDIAFGAPDDSFAYMDIGAKRTAGDIFAINGVKDYTTVAAAMVWVEKYATGKMASNGINKSSADLFDLYTEHAGISDSVPFGVKFKKSAIASPSMMTALHYICARKSRREADHFFTIAGDGFGAEGKFDPALVLRNKLIERNSNFERMHPTVASGLTLTAWNLSRMGRSGRGLRFDPAGTFPRAK